MDGNVTMNVVKKLGWQLYITNPYEHMYEKLDDMPKANYLNQVKIILYVTIYPKKSYLTLYAIILKAKLTFLRFHS